MSLFFIKHLSRIHLLSLCLCTLPYLFVPGLGIKKIARGIYLQRCGHRLSKHPSMQCYCAFLGIFRIFLGKARCFEASTSPLLPCVDVLVLHTSAINCQTQWHQSSRVLRTRHCLALTSQRKGLCLNSKRGSSTFCSCLIHRSIKGLRCSLS